MDLYLKDGMVFVDLGNGYLLCIGTFAEVQGADDNKVRKMVAEAVEASKKRVPRKTIQGATIH